MIEYLVTYRIGDNLRAFSAKVIITEGYTTLASTRKILAVRHGVDAKDVFISLVRNADGSSLTAEEYEMVGNNA